MTKQKELVGGLMAWMGAYGVEEADMVKAGIELFRYLASQGVAIKVEKEFPEHLMEGQAAYSSEDMARRIKESGYTAFEPLIEEKKK